MQPDYFQVRYVAAINSCAQVCINSAADEQVNLCLEIAPGALDSLSSLHLTHCHFRAGSCLASPTLRCLDIAYDAEQAEPLTPLGLLPYLTKLNIRSSATAFEWPPVAQAPQLRELCPNLKVSRHQMLPQLAPCCGNVATS